MKRTTSYSIGAGVLLLLACTSACFDLEKQYPEKRFYALSAERESADATATPAFDESLKLGRFRVSPRFASRGLTYRRSDVSYEADYYNEYLTDAASNLTEETRRWLSAARVFERVVDLGSQVDGCYILEARVNEIYADLRNAPASVLEVQFIVLRYGQAVSFEKTYTARTAAGGVDPPALVRAHNQSLAEILGQLENDLRRLTLVSCSDDS